MVERLGLRTALATVASALVLAVGATSAHAAIAISDSTPNDNQSVSVVGMAPTFTPNPATHYAVAECNVQGVALPADWAKRCNATSGGTPPRFRALTALGSMGTLSTSITVDNAFADFDFITQKPAGTSTTCKGASGSQCAVVVSYYRVAGGPPSFLGAEKKDVTFP